MSKSRRWKLWLGCGALALALLSAGCNSTPSVEMPKNPVPPPPAGAEGQPLKAPPPAHTPAP